MIKKLILIFFITGYGLLFADYYTSADIKFSDTKNLQYGDDLFISLDNSNISIRSKEDIDHLINENSPKEYKPLTLTYNNNDGEYNRYNFLYILKNDIVDSMFVIQTKNRYFLVEQKKRDDLLDTVFGKLDVLKVSFEVKATFHHNKQKTDTEKKDILTKYITKNGAVVGIKLLNNPLKKITKVTNPYLDEYINEIKKRKLTVERFNFKKEKIYTTYLSSTDKSQKRLNVNYEMKKKNIKVNTKSPVSLFDQEDRSYSTIEHVGLLREANRDLYELKKVQLIDGSSKVEWLNHPKKKVVIVEYENEGSKDKKLLSKTKRQQFYSIEGVIYLVHWMAKNNKSKKVFTFLNGSIPFDVTLKKISTDTYEMQKSGNVIYRFKTDDLQIVKTIEYPSYDLVIKLESIQSDTTKENKRFLENFASKHNIVLIKE